VCVVDNDNDDVVVVNNLLSFQTNSSIHGMNTGNKNVYIGLLQICVFRRVLLMPV
jgi:hypothetical protein